MSKITLVMPMETGDGEGNHRWRRRAPRERGPPPLTRSGSGALLRGPGLLRGLLAAALALVLVLLALRVLLVLLPPPVPALLRARVARRRARARARRAGARRAGAGRPRAGRARAGRAGGARARRGGGGARRRLSRGRVAVAGDGGGRGDRGHCGHGAGRQSDTGTAERHADPPCVVGSQGGRPQGRVRQSYEMTSAASGSSIFGASGSFL